MYLQNVQRYLYDIKQIDNVTFYKICANYSLKVFEILDINNEQATLYRQFF